MHLHLKIRASFKSIMDRQSQCLKTPTERMSSRRINLFKVLGSVLSQEVIHIVVPSGSSFSEWKLACRYQCAVLRVYVTHSQKQLYKHKQVII